jgi:hypothetical protein
MRRKWFVSKIDQSFLLTQETLASRLVGWLFVCQACFWGEASFGFLREVQDHSQLSLVPGNRYTKV